MTEAVKNKLRMLFALGVVGGLLGVIYMPFISETVHVGLAVRFFAQGVLITVLIFGFEIFVARGPAGEPLRRAPFAAAFAAKTLTTTALIVAAYLVGGVILFPDRFAGDAVAWDLIRDTGFALASAAVLQFVTMIHDVVGGRVLKNIVLGRYHRPLSEERLFMFLDIKDSTRLALELGSVETYAMISRFFFDVAQETIAYGGETHRYIGDEVVVTWPLEHGTADARCLRCYFAIRDRIEAKAGFYARKFGTVPDFRVGLHGGTVVAGECGDDKQEIVYFGDAINTAARLCKACKTFNRPLLLSGEILNAMSPGSQYRVVRVGKTALLGRDRETELFTVDR